ncbi:MAG TPA: alpha-2-macroglobulin family protein, partial [Opitutales bacterium]|nr:alpha-2-macroglobulin family protein [Opitutales bacterium]
DGDCFGKMKLCCDYFRDGSPVRMQQTLAIHAGHSPARVEVKAANPSLLPGRRQKLEIAVSTAEGKPAARVPVTVLAYDKSLDVLAGRSQIKPLSPDFFRIDRDYFGTWAIGVASSPLSRPRESFRRGSNSGYLAFDTDRFRGSIGYGEDEDIYFMSPFEVSCEEDVGYGTRETLAGTRLRTDLRDVASSISVVNRQLLQDTGATDADGLLLRTTNTEIGGVGGFFKAKDSAASRRQAYLPVSLRKNLAKLAFWSATEVTDGKGNLTVEFTVPESLTQWETLAYVTGSGDLLGSAEAVFTTSVPVSGRIAMPRFLVEGDDVALSVIAGNNGKETLPVRMRLGVTGMDGKAQNVLAGESAPIEREVAAGANARVVVCSCDPAT